MDLNEPAKLPSSPNASVPSIFEVRWDDLEWRRLIDTQQFVEEIYYRPNNLAVEHAIFRFHLTMRRPGHVPFWLETVHDPGAMDNFNFKMDYDYLFAGKVIGYDYDRGEGRNYLEVDLGDEYQVRCYVDSIEEITVDGDPILRRAVWS